MEPALRIDVITAFPAMFGPVFSESLLGRSKSGGILDIRVHDLRDHTADKRRTIDDYPFGGGCGMVLKPEPIHDCLLSVLGLAGQANSDDSSQTPPPSTRIILTSPQGRPFDQELAATFASAGRLIFICGHYEGIDERVTDNLVTDEVSIGDYVLTGGEIPVMAMVDAVARLLPGVVGKEESVIRDSFYSEKVFDHPHYTRPASWKGLEVPEALLTGNHAGIDRVRRQWALSKTARVRPDLVGGPDGARQLIEAFGEKPRRKKTHRRPLKSKSLDPPGLYVCLVHYPVLNKFGDQVATAVTNFDIHDICRSARTYGADGYLLVVPQEPQRELVRRIVGFWTDELAKIPHANRKDALSLATVVPTIAEGLDKIRRLEKADPLVVITSARELPGIDPVSYSELGDTIRTGRRPVVLMFGTGYGLAPAALETADLCLPPIIGPGEWNHLSVRAAAAIVLDRLLGM